MNAFKNSLRVKQKKIKSIDAKRQIRHSYRKCVFVVRTKYLTSAWPHTFNIISHPLDWTTKLLSQMEVCFRPNALFTTVACTFFHNVTQRRNCSNLLVGRTALSPDKHNSFKSNFFENTTLTSTTDIRQMCRQASYWGVAAPLHPHGYSRDAAPWF